MTLTGPWRTLGLEPTTDQAAIRRAYADRLRALDVDADPAGFARLRDAREAALAWARNPPAADEADEDEEWWGEEDEVNGQYRQAFSERELSDLLGGGFGPGRDAPLPLSIAPDPRPQPSPDPRVLADEPPAAEPARASPWVVPAIDYDAHYQAVLDLLFAGGGDDPLDAEDAAALGRHVDALLLDPRLDEIDYRDRAERWFADVLSDAGERADPVVERVVARFGWEADRGRIDQPWAMNWAATRAEAVRFLRRVAEPDHPYHPAWRELTRPDSERRPWRLDKSKVRTLLEAIRTEHPDLEAHLQPARVKQYEPGRARRLLGSIPVGGWLTWAAIAFVIFLIRACPLDDRSAPAVFDTGAPIADFPRAAEPALRSIGGETLTPARLQGANPALLGAVRAGWEAARRDRVTQFDYDRSLRTLLADRLRAAVRRADYDLVARLRRADLATARHARRDGDGLCDLYWNGGGEVRLTDPDGLSLERARAVIQGEVLLRYGGAPGPTSTQVFVPGALLDDVARRTGLPRDQIGESLRSGGTPFTRCAARIALVEAALALPPDQGLDLLRGM